MKEKNTHTQKIELYSEWNKNDHLSSAYSLRCMPSVTKDKCLFYTLKLSKLKEDEQIIISFLLALLE